MNWKRWAALALLGIAALVVLSACGTRLAFLAKGEPTASPSRTPRPTFTPRPLVTDTPQATDTPQTTATTPATDTPPPPTATKKPVVLPTKKPTQPPPPPPQPTSPPPPTQFPYQYQYVSPVLCEDSGGVYIQIFVYSRPHDPNAGQPGVKVRASWAPDAGPLGDTDGVTDDGGMFQYTLQTQLPAKPGTYYAWVIDGTGHRISDIGGPVNINNLGPGDPGSCKLAHVGFVAAR